MKRIKTAVLISGVFTIFTLLLTACATTPAPYVAPRQYYTVEVDSIADVGADLRGRTYTMSSAMKNTSDNDLQFKEFARYVGNALSQKGYKYISSKEGADLLIRLAYGIGSPKTETSTRTYNTSGGYSYPVGWTWIHVPPTTKTVTTSSTTYARFLILEAYDSKDHSQLWKTTLKSEGTTSDLRIALPHIIAAGRPYFGTNTGQKLKVNVESNGPEVIQIKRGSTDAHSISHFTGKERLGVTITPLTQEYMNAFDLEKKEGVVVLEIAENSLAQEMGVQKQDIILTVNEKVTNEPQVLLEEIKNTESGGKILLLIYRDGERIHISGQLK
ncbi:DUF4136 domain-containing protein [Desulfobacula sp.]|uniref:DUF4136 domain-containing protein n=1 Tax=Desulfobacula sp. TaxID=2593537 RepID=UPI00263A054E|nr:DUF4136 domain-containing protein [Desulfobacula sp.]